LTALFVPSFVHGPLPVTAASNNNSNSYELVCAYLSCELQKPTGAICIIPCGPFCHVASITMQRIVTSSELNLFWGSTAPCFPMTNHWDGRTVATYLNSDAVCTCSC
jgi:hypothetical protein